VPREAESVCGPPTGQEEQRLAKLNPISVQLGPLLPNSRHFLPLPAGPNELPNGPELEKSGPSWPKKKKKRRLLPSVRSR